MLDLLAKPQDQRPDMVVASLNLEQRGEGLELVKAVRAAHDPGVRVESARPPVILVGDGERRAEALEAGASAFIAKPAFVKDIVTLAGILAMGREGLEPGWGGDLGALHLYYVVRALGAARRTGVLSLVRGGRRGELRFYDGEVTSAQVGGLHGQAAFHQLLLWPEAHFDLRAEQVLRRQQIPLSPAELLQDAERFLRDYNELASGVSPSSRYEHDPRRAAECVDQIPREVTPVLRLFDGMRSIADVIEDSPTRLAETLKIVKKLIALGAIKKLGAPRPLADTAPLLLVDDWVVGGPSDGRPVPIEPREEPARRPREAATVAVGDWGMGMNQAVWGAASYAPVVPSQSAKGEISVGPPVVTAASSSDMIKKSGPGSGSAEGVDPSTGRTNGKTKGNGEAVAAAPRSGDGRKGSKKDGGGKALKAVAAEAPPPTVAASTPPAPHSTRTSDDVDTERNRPVPRSKSKSGEISAPTVTAVEKGFTSAPPIEVAPDVPAVMLPAPPPEFSTTAPVRVTRSRPVLAAAPPPHERFEDHEEAFFSQEEHFEKAEPPAAESFADLDEGQPRLGFWKRLFKKMRG